MYQNISHYISDDFKNFAAVTIPKTICGKELDVIFNHLSGFRMLRYLWMASILKGRVGSVGRVCRVGSVGRVCRVESACRAGV